QREHDGQDDFRSNACPGVDLGILKQAARSDETNQRDRDGHDPDEHKDQTLIMAEAAGQLRRPQMTVAVSAIGFGESSHKQVEFLDDETKCNYRDASTYPSEESALVCGMI